MTLDELVCSDIELLELRMIVVDGFVHGLLDCFFEGCRHIADRMLVCDCIHQIVDGFFVGVEVSFIGQHVCVDGLEFL